MIITTLVETITTDKDLDKLREIMLTILGQECWEASLSYGDELCLEIGDKIAYNHPIMKHKNKGTWRFGSRCTDWILENQGQVIINSDLEPEQIKQQIKIIEGTIIKDFDTHYPDLILTIKFSNGYQLKILPNLSENDPDIAYWELFTPNDMLLQIEPGLNWSYLPTNVPINQETKSY